MIKVNESEFSKYLKYIGPCCSSCSAAVVQGFLKRNIVLKDRCLPNTKVGLFSHSFCYSILRNYGVNEFDNKFRIIGDEKKGEEDELSKHVAPETVFEVIHKLLIEQCEDTEYLLQLKRYILDYVIDKIHLKKADPKFLPKDGKYFSTLDGIKVRSKSEQFIADWFYRHSIKYEYEPLLNVKDFSFHPDFYIPQANLYIEHIRRPGSSSSENVLSSPTYSKNLPTFSLLLEPAFRTT